MSKYRGNQYRYQIYRSEARKHAQELAQGNQNFIARGIDTAKIRYEPITQAAIEASDMWGENETLYPWDSVVHEWKQEDTRGFDISLWFDQELCGLCYASPRKSKLCIKIVILEGKPDSSHPLRGAVAALALTAIENYAVLIGCTEIEVQEPAIGAIPVYESLGFAFDSSGRLVTAVEQ
ncbi:MULTISPECIES: N-acetyltransferase [unclassified Pseudomonas]|uniref:N-acetyltransferase n=1 Tax=unclassified Pseudomonas TaxID=196821 RepID=UPI002E81C1B2|nr:N-acetyltransferase [Pseudomonas sp. 10C3]MEE3507603.1 N-acetyltransferase [Pseudomonas sp. 10C3]